LELLERRTRFDGLMLSGVANEQHAIFCSDAREEFMQIFGASE